MFADNVQVNLDGGKQNQLESGSHKKGLGLKVRLIVYISTVL